MRRAFIALFLASAALAAAPGASADPPKDPPQRNVVIFVADGLRSGVVDAETAPGFEAVKRDGVYFAQSHSLFPTVTTANASAIATGHALGDTGDYGNLLYGSQVFQGPLSNPTFLTGSFNLYRNAFQQGHELLTITATPLPVALPLFATGLAGLGWFARRRRKHGAA